MSMNLHVEFDKVAFDLIQTPTWLTYLCLMDHEGLVSTKTGREGKRALHCYLQWVSQLPEDPDWPFQKNHRAELLDKMNTCRRLEVYCL